MATLLVTGGAGFIGANFVYYWRSSHSRDKIVILDLLTYAGNLTSLEPLLVDRSVQFVKGDICDEPLLGQIFEDHDIDIVVHFAAESHVDRSISAPDEFVRTNINGTHALLKAALNAWETRRDKRFHHISTDEVYGSLEPNDPRFTEDTAYSPRSPYAASKAASDFLVRAYAHTYGLPVTISNCSNNYGPYQFPEKLIPLVLVNALEGRPLPVYGDGLNVRDWLYVEDHCVAIASVIERGRPGSCYNIGGENEISNIDLVHMLCDRIDARFAMAPELAHRFPAAPAARGRPSRDLISFVKDRPGHDRRYAVDCTKIALELGCRPSRSFRAGLDRTLNWYLENEQWWRSILKGNYRDWVANQYGWTV